MKFSFGENWKSFSDKALTDKRIREARHAFAELTNGIELKNKKFMDIGFGQGLALFLCAEYGALAHGIDIDPICNDAITSTHRFFASLSRPITQVASILDEKFVDDQQALGGYDVVHSWGVLHHTGDMKRAFKNIARLVKPGGYLMIAIYNKSWTSPIWKAVKIIYNQVPSLLQYAMVWVLYLLNFLREPFLKKKRNIASSRGMELFHEIRDWLGGYPYEYATREEVLRAFAEHGFVKVKVIPSVGWTGCNQFVLCRSDESKSNNKMIQK
jgi:2-polyprenyl-6-hydroxyphenyl methylase/3-demethylubiquinone-9 3-methyltransferase